MNIRRILPFILLALVSSAIVVKFLHSARGPSAIQLLAASGDFTNALREVLKDQIDLNKEGVGIVVGIVDENGPRVISYGKVDNEDSPEVNGDTMFEIGSITKTFTALLLQDMVERGEMKLDDPVAKYLPESVKMPTHGGKEITLLQLATHTSGLPRDPDNLTPRQWANYYENYTAEQLYAFLSGHTLIRDPGAKYEYSNLGGGLLGQAIALKAGTNYESLIRDRICAPLKMESTVTTVTPALRSRSAVGHDFFRKPTGDMLEGILVGAGGIHSTANDMLKYLSANVGLTRTSLTEAMEKMHETRFKQRSDDGADSQATAWISQGDNIFWHAGGTWGFSALAEFQKKQRRGIVILSNIYGGAGLYPLSRLLLNNDWQIQNRPKIAALDYRTYDSYVGRYQLTSNCVLGIRRDGNRLLAQLKDDLSFVLLPESATNFFVKITGKSVSFIRDGNGKVVSLFSDIDGARATFVRISDVPPEPVLPPKPPVFVNVTEEALDAFVGQYRFSSGGIFRLAREQDHLILTTEREVSLAIYTESETKASCPNLPLGVTLVRNDKGKVGSVTVYSPAPEFTGNALKINH